MIFIWHSFHIFKNLDSSLQISLIATPHSPGFFNILNIFNIFNILNILNILNIFDIFDISFIMIQSEPSGMSKAV
jgi:hypothetical protein